MRRHIRAFRHGAHIAEIATIHYLPISGFLHCVQFAGRSLIYEID
jgi:hypothetical protein